MSKVAAKKKKIQTARQWTRSFMLPQVFQLLRGKRLPIRVWDVKNTYSYHLTVHLGDQIDLIGIPIQVNKEGHDTSFGLVFARALINDAYMAPDLSSMYQMP